MHHVMPQVLPHLVHGLVDDELTRLVAQACRLAMLICCRRSQQSFTSADLQHIDDGIEQLQDTLGQLYGAEFIQDKPKFHKLSHLTTDIRDLGHPREYNSDMWEADHVYGKRAYE